MPRIVAPEILDTLPAGAREARRSRRDLRLINIALGNRAWFRRSLSALLRPGDRLLELGPGDSRLHTLAPDGIAWDGIDRCERPAAWPASARWHQTDLLEFSGWHDYTVIVANLVLHHFSSEELASLGARLAPHARLLLASEPVRRRRHQRFFTLFCRCIDACAVTRHDGVVSIAAGFVDDELPASLGLHSPEWQCSARAMWPGVHRLIAQRTP